MTSGRAGLLCLRPWASEPGFKGVACNNAYAVAVVQIFLGRGWLRRLVPGGASRGGAKRRATPWTKGVRPRAARPVRFIARGRFVSREAASNRARHLFQFTLNTLRCERRLWFVLKTPSAVSAVFGLCSKRLRL